MYRLTRPSWGSILTIVFSMALPAVWASEPLAVQQEHVVTEDNYPHVIRAIRKGELDDNKASIAVHDLFDLYLRSGNNSILWSIAELRATAPKVLDTALRRILEVVKDPPSDKVQCDVCDMLIRLKTLPSAVEEVLLVRFSETKAAEVPRFSQFKEAAVLLKFTANDAVRGWLEAHCGHPKKYIRVASAHALGSIGKEAGAQSVAILNNLLDDPSAAVRTTAANAIWTLTGDPESVLPVLVAALNDPSEPIVLRPTSVSEWGFSHRDIAVISLGQIKSASPPVIDCLIPLLHEKNDTALQVFTIQALGELGDRSDRVLQAIGNLVDDPDPALRTEAARALRHLKGQASP